MRTLLKLDVFCITDLHILLLWLRFWRWWWWLSIFPRYSDIMLMLLLLRLPSKTKEKEIRKMLQLDAFCLTDLHILLLWLRLWRRRWNIFPRHPDITLMMLLLPSMMCVAKLNTCIVMLLKSTVQLFIPIGALLMVVQLPVMVCNCMARQSRITLNRNRCMSWMMSWNLHRHRHWSSWLIAIWILGMVIVPQTIDILARMIVGRERR